ncbi:methyltransferase family protein [Teredinibacter purpureus]|uniref:methyltransferase family protein n=1 Tax=Teredinibacter purpureus TaxID=2731756 RepID=UPI0019102236|nr:isoprenylcysteine carboxylmethyltransferase family protein [Teredinibacter purpureus]
MLKNRVPPVIVLALFLGLSWAISWCTPSIEFGGRFKNIVSAIILLVGGVFCMAGVWSFRKSKTTVDPLNPKKASALVVFGVYRFSRNPMYVGFAMCLIAFCIALASPFSLLSIVGFVVYMNEYQIKPEEQALRKNFGDAFLRYSNRVSRWL